MRLSVSTPGAALVSVQEAKRQLRLEDDHAGGLEDALIDSYLAAAQGWAEAHTGRAFTTQVLVGTLDRFPCAPVLELPRAPLRSVTSVAYVDDAGDPQVLASSAYVVDAPAGPLARRGRIGLKVTHTWPSTLSQINAVTITFEAGYGAAADVPKAIVAAVLLMVGALFAQREDVSFGVQGHRVPLDAKNLLVPYRLPDYRPAR